MIPRGRAIRVFEHPMAAPPAAVRDLLGSPHRIPELHPLVTRVTIESDTSRDGVRRMHFALDERVPLGPLRVPNRYHGTIELRDDAPLEVFVSATSRPAIEVQGHFAIAPDGSGSWVRETLTVSAAVPMLGFVVRTAESAHRAQLVALANLLRRA